MYVGSNPTWGTILILRKNMKKLPKRIKEKFIVDEHFGMASAAISLSKPGYVFEKMERKLKDVIITFRRIDK